MRKPFPNGLRHVLGLACGLALLGAATPLRAQENAPPAPYDSIGANGVTYDGPGRDAAFDLRGSTIHIGILAPIHGPQKADGEAIIAAARIAIQDASRKPLPGGRHLALSIADESVPPWGLLGDEIIHLVMQDKVAAIVTGADGVAAHLSEQIGNKIGVATLTLSGDDTTTEINMPWIFRMGPSDAQQAQGMARNIYQVHGYRRVLLVSGQGHDGQIASKEFLKEVHKLGAPAPASVVINPLQLDASALLSIIQAKAPQAIVFWTLPENGKELIHAIRAEGCHTPIYLSQKTAQAGSGLGLPLRSAEKLKDPAGMYFYTVDSRQAESPLRKDFVQRYQLATGTLPSPVAAEAYDAVRLVAQAIRKAGPNRARVRDRISTARNLAGVSGTITFDDQGNNRTETYLVRLQERTLQQASRARSTPPHRKVKVDTQE
ncbi:MAG TPA: ABC transporter substrate-binding protein [Acidobacteriaceae bacterium]|nr:ABC transporter substrate-binding protein [Acidobacteriaceae bacterium]